MSGHAVALTPDPTRENPFQWALISNEPLPGLDGGQRRPWEQYPGIYAYPFPTIAAAAEAGAKWDADLPKNWAVAITEEAERIADQEAEAAREAAELDADLLDRLARDVYESDNANASEQTNAEDWAAMLAGQGTDTYAHGIARGLLARGWTLRREIAGADLHTLQGYACIAEKGSGTVYVTWGSGHWEAPGSYAEHTTEELSKLGPFVVLQEGSAL